ncbi:MAG TPA: hypothetical protein DEA96_14490, partial [Leptospiraceae bacterium]|nr:hypothetical protein [Leptospiraceae bacterium]
MRARNEWILASSIAIGLFLIYVSAPLYYGSDADYAVPQIVTILQDGNQNLDEYSHLLGKQYQLQKIDGHIYDYFPFGTVYLALVPASILTLIYDSNYISLHRFEFSIILASILMAIACAFIYRIGRLNALNRSGATLLALYAGLGTSILSTGTRALWQQTGCLFVAFLCLWLFEKWKASRRSAWLIPLGALLGFGFLVRPTMLLFALCFGLYFLISERRIGWRILYLALPGLMILAMFVIQSLVLFQSWLPPYYLAKMPASH